MRPHYRNAWQHWTYHGGVLSFTHANWLLTLRNRAAAGRIDRYRRSQS